MRNSFMIFTVFLFAFTVFQQYGIGQEKPADAIYIIFDASGSMWQQLPDKSYKIEVAKKVLKDFVAGEFKEYELALRAYGHRRKGDCLDSELVIPFGAPKKVVSRLKEFMNSINPIGKTPITYSLREALKDFGDRSGEIILISDGIETCDEDPCALIREWREKDVQIKVHVVGLGLDEKSKEAMKCISDAAGTDYHDAGSASDLAEELAKIQQQATSAAFLLHGVDAAGNLMRVEGVLSQDGKDIFQVASNRRNQVEAGEYILLAGAKTRNGNLYEPVTKTVQVAETGETTVKVEVEVPPSVKVKFMEDGKEKRDIGSVVIHAFQDEKEIFKFRSIDEVYVDEGTYEFRAQPNRENDLSVSESFSAGDQKEIVFKMIHTVLVTVKMAASGSGIWFRENTELWQGGKKKYMVHQSNGARVFPGKYDLHLPNPLTPYVKPGIVVTEESKQHFDVIVPVGHVTVIYQKADGTPDKNDRCFIGRGPTGRGTFKRSGERHPLTPGTYNVTGWSKKGQYDPVVFEIKEGEEREIVLRGKK